MLQIDLFGGLRIRTDVSEPVDLPPQQVGMLLAYLALNAGRSHPREELIELLWPEVDPEDGRQRLRQAIYSLRRQLESLSCEIVTVLIATRSVVHLDASAVRTDVGAFEERIHAAATMTEPAARARLLQDAADLYRGPLFAGCYLEPIISARHRLEEMHRVALKNLAAAYSESGLIDRAIETAQAVVDLDPLDEEAHCDLMRLYVLNRQPSAALRQYQEMRRVLCEELSEEPGEASRKLMLAIRASRPESPPVCPDKPSLVCPLAPDLERPSLPGQSAVPSRRSNLRVLPLAAAVMIVIGFVAWTLRRPAPVPHAPPPALTPGAEAAIPAGRYEWIRRYPRGRDDGDSEVTAMTGDLQGNIYATGLIRTASHDVDFLTLKYSSDGRLLWEKRFNGSGNDLDRARSIAVDSHGNVYVTGESDNGTGDDKWTRLAGCDWVTIKYDSKGSEVWRDRFNGDDNGEDRPAKLLLGRDDELWVVGASRSRRGGNDFAIVKYRPDGKREFVKTYDSTAHDDDNLADAVLDKDGNLYVTGASRAKYARGWESDILTLRYNRDGKVAWERRLGEANGADDRGRTIGLDRMGRVYVIGEGRGAPGTPDEGRVGCITVKYSPQGDPVWVRGAMRASERLARVISAIVADDGHTFVTGVSPPVGGVARWRTVDRDEGCATVWTHDFGAVQTEDGPVALSVGVQLYLVGTESTPHAKPGSDQRDMVALRYAAGGTPVKRWVFDGAGDFDRASAITTFETQGHAMVTAVAGQSSGGKTRDIVIMKLAP